MQVWASEQIGIHRNCINEAAMVLAVEVEINPLKNCEREDVWAFRWFHFHLVRSGMGASPSVPEKSIHQFCVKVKLLLLLFNLEPLHASVSFLWAWDQDARGQDVDLSIYKGKVLLVVNVASKWFFSFPTLIFWVFSNF